MSTSEASSSQHIGNGAYPTIILALQHRIEGKWQVLPIDSHIQARQHFRALQIPIRYFVDFRTDIPA
jgi:hypothetical protein